jgi:hypothetical protein
MSTVPEPSIRVQSYHMHNSIFFLNVMYSVFRLKSKVSCFFEHFASWLISKHSLELTFLVTKFETFRLSKNYYVP